MKNRIEKMRRWLKMHRMSRKQATLQNLCLTLLFAALFVVLARGYMADHSVEAAVEQWCEENFFGEAEIVAAITFEEDKHQQKQIFIEKVVDEDLRYEARLDLLRENPWKWVCVGSSYSNSPKEENLIVDLIEKGGERVWVIPAEAVQGSFPEFAGCQFLEAMYTTVHIVEDENTVNNSYPGFQVYAGYSYDVDEITPELLLYGSSSFRMNLRTGEMGAVDFEPFEMDGKEATLWVSDERLKRFVHTLMETLPAPKK